MRPHWRKMTWTIIVWTILLGVWMIDGSVSGSHQAAKDCAHPGVLTRQQCLDASHTGTGVGVALLFVLWFIGFVVLSLVWFMSRPRQPVAA